MKIGDALSQYFFKLVMAKRIKESIKLLTLPDGRVTKDERKFSMEFSPTLGSYIRNIRGWLALMVLEYAEILKFITKKFSVVDNHALMALPSCDEVERVLLNFPTGFPKDKSLGGDGLMIFYRNVGALWGTTTS